MVFGGGLSNTLKLPSIPINGFAAASVPSTARHPERARGVVEGVHKMQPPATARGAAARRDPGEQRILQGRTRRKASNHTVKVDQLLESTKAALEVPGFEPAPPVPPPERLGARRGSISVWNSKVEKTCLDLFKLYDLDKDGFLDRDEHMPILQAVDGTRGLQQLHGVMMFHCFDIGKTGKISASTWVNHLRASWMLHRFDIDFFLLALTRSAQDTCLAESIEYGLPALNEMDEMDAAEEPTNAVSRRGGTRLAPVSHHVNPPGSPRKVRGLESTDLLADSQLSPRAQGPASVLSSKPDVSQFPLPEELAAMYRLHAVLGQGAFGTVFKARRIAEDAAVKDDWVAFKMVRCQDNKDIHLMAKAEAQQMLSASHPNIVGVYRFVETPTADWMMMELCSGTLSEHIVNHGLLKEEMGREVFYQICDAVNYLHNTMQLVHRDLKTDNILVTAWPKDAPPDQPLTIKLGDFGLARSYCSTRQIFQVAGTMNFMAPELLSDETGYGRGVDMWSCGVILFYLLNGGLPFRAKKRGTLKMEIQSGVYKFRRHPSKACEDLVGRLLCIDPLRRITVKEALAHPWMYGLTELSNTLHKGVFEMLRNMSSLSVDSNDDKSPTIDMQSLTIDTSTTSANCVAQQQKAWRQIETTMQRRASALQGLMIPEEEEALITEEEAPPNRGGCPPGVPYEEGSLQAEESPQPCPRGGKSLSAKLPGAREWPRTTSQRFEFAYTYGRVKSQYQGCTSTPSSTNRMSAAS